MADNEKRMLDIQRGSIVNSPNKTVGKDNWCMVLGCMENHDTFTAVRLTDDQAFKDVICLKVNIDSDIFGKGVEVYANPFAILNLKVDWISEVRCPVPMQDYYGVVSTITNYFMGFLMKMEDGHFEMDIPYLQNPLYPIMMGMVNINQAHDMELNSRIKMAERKKKKEEKEKEEKLSKIKPVKRVPKGGNNKTSEKIKEQFESLNVYKMETQERIDTIYKIFSPLLASGERLSVSAAYAMIFENANPRRMRNGANAVTKEEFAFIVNNDGNSIKERLGLNSIQLAYKIRNNAICIFNGKPHTKLRRKFNNPIATEQKEFVKTLIANGANDEQILKELEEKFGISENEAKSIRNAVVNYTRRLKYGDQYNRYNQIDDKLIRLMTSPFVAQLKANSTVVNFITNNCRIIGQIHDGSVNPRTGFPFLDFIIKITVERSFNLWKPYGFLLKEEYRYIVDWFNSHDFNDIAEFYNERAVESNNFLQSPVIFAKIVCHFIGISKEEKLACLKILNGESTDSSKLYPLFRVAAAYGKFTIGAKLVIAKVLEVDDIELLIKVASTPKIWFSNLEDYSGIKRIAISHAYGRAKKKK